MINLIRNALKFTPVEGHIDILVSYDKTKRCITVEVKDSGIGIKAEDLDSLFTLFGKLQRTASMNSDGLGLGLRICKEIVE